MFKDIKEVLSDLTKQIAKQKVSKKTTSLMMKRVRKTNK